MIRALDVTDPETAKRLLVMQHAAYAVEAELIGFDGIPPLHEDLAGLMTSTEHWLGRYAPAVDAPADGARADDAPAADAPEDGVPAAEAGAGGAGDQVLVGAVAYEFPDARTLEISRLVIDPAHARQGHARALLDHLDTLGPRPTTLVSTGSANTPAVSLYLSRGFTETGRTAVAHGVEVTHFARSGSPAHQIAGSDGRLSVRPQLQALD